MQVNQMGEYWGFPYFDFEKGWLHSQELPKYQNKKKRRNRILYITVTRFW